MGANILLLHAIPVAFFASTWQNRAITGPVDDWIPDSGFVAFCSFTAVSALHLPDSRVAGEVSAGQRFSFGWGHNSVRRASLRIPESRAWPINEDILTSTLLIKLHAASQH